MNRKERRAAQKRGGPTLSPMAQTLATAFHAHQAGHRSEAERLYRDVLAIEPRNAPALHLLGALLHQSGRTDEAISLMHQAIAIEPRNPDYHYNLGSILQSAGRMSEAIAQLENAVALKSNYAEAHFELGNAYARLEDWDKAAANFRSVLNLKPADTAALNNLGMVLREQGKNDEAIELWQRAVAKAPAFALAHMNLGLGHKLQGRPDEAIASLNKALEAAPDSVDVICNLASVQIGLGFADQALQTLLRAIEKSPSPELRALFVVCLLMLPSVPTDERMRGLIARALNEGWSRAQPPASVAIALLKSGPILSAAIARVNRQWPQPIAVTEMLPPGGLAVIANDKLLLAALEAAPIADFELERILIGLRFACLAAAREAGDNAEDGILPLACALAQQCFLNGYVWPQSDDEANRFRELQNAAAAALQAGRSPSALGLAALACYVPLHALPFAALLEKQAAPEPAAALIRKQLQEPAQEQALRAKYPVVPDERTNPWPRWSGLAFSSVASGIEVYLRNIMPQATIAPLGKSGPLDILVADCGSGQGAIEIARRHPSATIVASDPSAVDIAFGEREAQRRGISNIAWTLTESDRGTFDVIDATGSLRKAANGREQMRRLSAMLRARGVMLMSFDGEGRRNAIRAAQEVVRAGNYQPDTEGIRLVRQNILRLPEQHAARMIAICEEFYSTDGCRALLFAQQSDPLSFGNIAQSLEEAGLTVVAFDADRRFAARYAARFPQDRTMTDFNNWQMLEAAEPTMAMVSHSLWVQKR
jgi:tetratricopeptide (TPR) repeat protein